MDLESILNTIQPFLVMFVALLVAFLTAIWVSAVIWAFRDIRARTRDIFAQILASLMVFLFFPLFPLPGLILYWILRPRETLAEIYERTLEEEALLQGIEERLACPACNRRIEDDYVVCPSCHTRLKKRCIDCGRHLHLRWNLCPYCGAAQTPASVQPVEPVILPASQVPEAAKLLGSAPSSLPEPVSVTSTQPTLGEGDADETPTFSDSAWEAEGLAAGEETVPHAAPDTPTEGGAEEEPSLRHGAAEELAEDVSIAGESRQTAADPVAGTEEEPVLDTTAERDAEAEPSQGTLAAEGQSEELGAGLEAPEADMPEAADETDTVSEEDDIGQDSDPQGRKD